MKVSICTPTYENPQQFVRLLTSLEQQTFQDYELIVTDDSTSNLIFQECEKKRERLHIKYNSNRVRLGATANCNEAVSLATGNYVKIMHQDDWFSGCDSLGKMVDMLDNNPRAILGFTGTNQVSSESSFSREISIKELLLIGVNYNNLYYGNYIGAPSATIYRNCDVSFDNKLDWLMDVDFYLTLLKRNRHFAYSREHLINIGVSDTQMTQICLNDGELMKREYDYVYQKHGLRRYYLCRKMHDQFC